MTSIIRLAVFSLASDQAARPGAAIALLADARQPPVRWELARVTCWQLSRRRLVWASLTCRRRCGFQPGVKLDAGGDSRFWSDGLAEPGRSATTDSSAPRLANLVSAEAGEQLPPGFASRLAAVVVMVTALDSGTPVAQLRLPDSRPHCSPASLRLALVKPKR